MTYQTLSLIYDRLMGDRAGEVDRLRKLLHKHHPSATSLLELACGSGALLHPLARHYAVAGLDLSPHMLARAKKRLPNTPLALGSMTSHNLRQRFDIVLCLFDSINHLTSFHDWQRLFANAARHLNPQGLFLFDINTLPRLAKLTGSQSIAPVGKDLVLFRVTSSSKGSVTWNIDLFQHQSKDTYRLLKERIEERSFPIPTILDALHKHFPSITLLNEHLRPTTTHHGRRYFLCRR